MIKKSLLPLAAALLLSGCANELYGSLPLYMQSKHLPEVRIENFPHCEGYGCPIVKNVELNAADWKTIERAYGGKAETAKNEREKIARTIGVFEQVVGPITGTDVDKAGTFIQTGKGQLDCVDESSNTTIYLILLKEKGLLTFHTIDQPQVRYPIVSGRGWMHQTAVVTERATGDRYAVDSWFDDNGAPARIIPLQDWLNGWHLPD